ncbi:MAG: metal-dependent hydrolase [Gammaproteobacteria bacterium]|nr:metal-dependent hydrolase [Gammaproteobacteria bacterium]
MPFTPLHMGPGLLIKSFLHGSFSLMVFGWAQIVMDIQPLFVMLSGEGHLHGFSHTFLGATLLGLFAALSGKYLAEFGLLLLEISNKENPVKILWWVTCLSAFIGTYSHVLLDAIMHGDVELFYPVNTARPLLGLLSTGDLHKFCIYSGLAGTGIYYFVLYKLNNVSQQ